jgi:hypothetical protein
MSSNADIRDLTFHKLRFDDTSTRFAASPYFHREVLRAAKSRTNKLESRVNMKPSVEPFRLAKLGSDLSDCSIKSTMIMVVSFQKYGKWHDRGVSSTRMGCVWTGAQDSSLL